MQRSCLIALVFLTASTSVSIMARAEEGKIRFGRDIRPILSNHCFTCHGPDANTREGGFRLDRRDSAVGEADSGATPIKPGDAALSELLKRVGSADPNQHMPPPDAGKRLTAAQIQLLEQWIEQGAEYESHWAFSAPEPTAPPSVKMTKWPRNDIDRFVLARLESEGLDPTKTASRETLIRRVAFDLTGLPPTLDEVDKFVNDAAPKAYERMVDRYLNSPAYGEHMARHWLDLARYADSNGYQYDTERQQWVWRDWVIHAYNRNMRFDQFTIEQIAGDLIPDATPQQRLATGFNRNHGVTIEGGIIDEEYRTEYVMDRLVTTGAAWMGLTIGCARCHDHKFDPISQKEFYQLYAYFNQVPERGMRGFAPQQQIPSPLAASQMQKFDDQLKTLKSELAKPLNVDPAFNAWAKELASKKQQGWSVLVPLAMKSSGGTTLTKQADNSLLTSGANPRKDVYEITAATNETGLTAIRLQALTHPSLPGGGPGRHSNSNFVLSEFELKVVSVADPSKSKQVKFSSVRAEYSQKGYEVAKAIDGTVAGNNGWAVDGPTRKKPVSAIFVAAEPFGFAGGSRLQFRLRHEASFSTHGVGRPRLSVTGDEPASVGYDGTPGNILVIAKMDAKQRTKEQVSELRKFFLKRHDPRKAIRERIAAIEKQRNAAFPATMVMQELPKPRQTFMLNRGQYNEPADLVRAGVPAVFPPLKKDAPANRLGFAQWLTDPGHPLTARVAVNRYWQRLFGVGLVKTSEDFGLQGEMPSHPRLLDWLAREFVEEGWNVKQMHRLILNSATYRQSSKAGAKSFERDPENRLMSRGPRMRLDAEEIRDAALSISGLLVKQVGGKSVYPYQPKGLWLELNNRPGYSKAYPVGAGDDLLRRSMYTFWKRTVPSPMLKTFDAPEREFCTIRRSRTNTPLQALLLMNGPQFVEAARGLGQRMMRDGGDTVDAKLRYGFRLATARAPSAAELAVLREAIQQDRRFYQADPDAVKRLLSVGAKPIDGELDAAELAAYVSVARLILNLNETITKG